MQVSMYDWAGNSKGLPSWFKHQTVAEVSWEQIQELFDTGKNVMLCHAQDGIVILYIDSLRFTQR